MTKIKAMKPTERDWKAALVFRTWCLVQNRLGMVPVKQNFKKLTDFEKSPFRFVAESRQVSPFEAAWDRDQRRRSSANASPFREFGLHPQRSIGRGPMPRR